MSGPDPVDPCTYLRDLRAILAEADGPGGVERLALMKRLWTLHARAAVAGASDLSLGAIMSIIAICTTLPAAKPVGAPAL